jgi:hypothetical protein
VNEVGLLRHHTRALLSAVGTLLDKSTFKELNAVCTAVNDRASLDSEAASGRFVVWTPLPPFSQASAGRALPDADGAYATCVAGGAQRLRGATPRSRQ